MKLLADAMVKAGTVTDKAKLISQLARRNYKGVAGTYSFDEDGDLKGAPTAVYIIKNGPPVPCGQRCQSSHKEARVNYPTLKGGA